MFALTLARPPQAPPDRASEILARARQAIGGETRLRAVRTLSVKAWIQTAPPDRQNALMGLQIDFALPDRFLIVRERPYFRRVGGFNGDEPIEQRQIDGVWGDVLPDDAGRQAVGWPLAARRRECTRYLVAWLLMAPNVRFTYAGEAEGTGEAAGRQVDVIDATGEHGFAARLFFGKGDARLLMMTYREAFPDARAGVPAERNLPEKGEPLFKSIQKPGSEADLVVLQFDDRHADDGIVFPHAMRIDAEGLHEQWKISRFRVNPDIDMKEFRKR